MKYCMFWKDTNNLCHNSYTLFDENKHTKTPLNTFWSKVWLFSTVSGQESKFWFLPAQAVFNLETTLNCKTGQIFSSIQTQDEYKQCWCNFPSKQRLVNGCCNKTAGWDVISLSLVGLSNSDISPTVSLWVCSSSSWWQNLRSTRSEIS